MDIPQEAQLTIALGMGAVLQAVARVIAARAHRRWSMRPPREPQHEQHDPDLISFSPVELEAYARRIREAERERLERNGQLKPAWRPDDDDTKP